MIINLNLENDKDLIKLIFEHLEKKIETNEVVEPPKRGRGRPRLHPKRDPTEPHRPRGRPRKFNVD